MDIVKKIIEKGVYPYMEKRRGNLIRQRTKELLQSQYLSPQGLRDMQGDKLKKLLVHCINNVPAYEKYRYLESAIKADPFSSLKTFPILEKSRFKSEFDTFLSRNATEKSLIVNQTGGSTSEPVKFFMDRHMVEYYEAARWRGLSWWGISPGSPSVMIWGNPQDLNKLGKRTYYLKERWLKNRIMISAYDIKANRIRDYLDRINAFKPEYIYGYASALDLFAQLMLDQGLSLKKKVKAVVSTAETLYDYQRETIEKAFKSPIVNEYGARDGGIIAYQCGKGNMHVSSENVFIEVVDDKNLHGQALGETGIFLLTDLNNYVMPRLRYRIGDRGAISKEACSCGLGLPILSKLDGREADIFVTTEGKYIHGHAFNRLSRQIQSIDKFRIVQERPSYARLMIMPSLNCDQREVDDFISEIKRMLPGTEIDVNFVEDIPTGGSGKFRHAIREFSIE